MNSQRVKTSDGIDWYTETIQSAAAESLPSTSKQHIVLIPSGEGDCQNLAAVAKLLASSSPAGTQITTFDMPGFSRTTAPKEAYAVVSPELIAGQVVRLLDKLQISQPTFWGSSSGACTVLAIAALYPERVKCGIIHEPPLECPPQFRAMREGTDEELTQRCQAIFDQFIELENDGKQKYLALGEDYFRRLNKNFPTWMRCVVSNMEAETNELVMQNQENVKKLPIFWTIGALSLKAMWQQDFVLAEVLGKKVETDVLNSNHFPYVTIPEDTTQWILKCMKTAESQQIPAV